MDLQKLKFVKDELKISELKILCTGELEVDYRDLLELQLLEDGRSLKRTDDDKILKLAESLLRFGIVNNLQVWFDDSEKCFCFDAHHRQKALNLLSEIGLIIPKLPATRCLAETKIQAKKLLLVKESRTSWVDVSVVADYIREVGFEFKVAEAVIDFPEFFWNEVPVDNKQQEADSLKDNQIPEIPAERVFLKSGDLLELGNHRVLCGDSTLTKDVEKLMGSEKADMVFIDPPFDLDDNYSQIIFKNVKNSCHVFIMNSDRKLIDNINNNYDFFRKIFAVDFRVPNMISNAQPMTRVDLIAEFNKGKGKFNNIKDCFTTLIKCSKLHGEKRGETLHSQEKKVELPETFILHYSRKKEIILDTFLGAGSTLIAAEKNGRLCFGIELSPIWCQVIIQRWVDFTENTEISINGKIVDWRELRGE